MSTRIFARCGRGACTSSSPGDRGVIASFTPTTTVVPGIADATKSQMPPRRLPRQRGHVLVAPDRVESKQTKSEGGRRPELAGVTRLRRRPRPLPRLAIHIPRVTAIWSDVADSICRQGLQAPVRTPHRHARSRESRTWYCRVDHIAVCPIPRPTGVCTTLVHSRPSLR